VSGSIRFEPSAMLDASGRLLALAEELEAATGATRGVSTAGFPPHLAAVAHATLAGVAGDLAGARATTGREARAIVAVALRAIALDKGGASTGLDIDLHKLAKGAGDSLKKFLEHLNDPMDWAVAGFLEALRSAGRGYLKESRDLPLARIRRLKWAKAYWEKNAWVRRQYASPRALQKSGAALAKRLRDIEKRTRWLDRLDPVEYLPKALRDIPLIRRIPVLGGALSFGAAIGEGRDVPDAAGKAATETAASVVGGMGGAALCGTAAAATFGLGAATCPALIGIGAIGGGIVGGAVYDPLVKPVAGVVGDGIETVVGGGKKVVHFVGGLL